ncbi:MAG: hypothetical protein ACRD5M_02080 [Candidatus Acidiferrales bacterium]
MDCATFKRIVHELDRPGTPGAAKCESALAHAESCAHCAALLTQVEWLEFSFHQVTENAATRQASPRVEAALLQEFRNAKALAARKQIRWRLVALAAAAALFLALGLSLRDRVAPVKGSAPDHAGQSAHQNSAPATNAARPESTQASDVNPHLSRQDSSAPDSSETDDAASFVRLPYADESADFDGGAIVRVELPRAALASFGLPVAEFGTSRPILADLVVSADGTPEAIRLVSQTSSSQEF